MERRNISGSGQIEPEEIEVCNLCHDTEISFRFNDLSLCQRDRGLVFRALLYDYWKAGVIGQMIDEFYQKGPRALDQPKASYSEPVKP